MNRAWVAGATEEIGGAVRIVASGEVLLAPAVTRAVIEGFARREPPPARGAARILAELGVPDRVHAVIWAYGNGVVTPGSGGSPGP